MKNTILLLLSISVFIFYSCQDNSSNKERYNVMSFNIRYNNPNEGINRWENRKNLAAEVFSNYQIDIAGLQEVTEVQLDDLSDRLAGYHLIGVGRRDGKYGGEHCPIFFKKSQFKLLEHGTQWLSENPEKIGSVGWDAVLPRIFTWGKFRNNSNDKTFYFFNTHFDHRGDTARLKSSRLLINKINELIDESSPVIITGDFNYTSNSEGYNIITGKNNPKLFKDTKDIAQTPFKGIAQTINRFNEEEAPKKIIDFIFVNEEIIVEKYDILRIKKNNIYISDHYPVFSTITF